MKITKELLIGLIKEELNERTVRKLDVIAGSTIDSKMFGENHQIIMTKRKNTTTNKITYIVALVHGTGKDESLMKEYTKEFKEEKKAEDFYNRLKSLKSLKDVKNQFKNKNKEGENES